MHAGMCCKLPCPRTDCTQKLGIFAYSHALMGPNNIIIHRTRRPQNCPTPQAGLQVLSYSRNHFTSRSDPNNWQSAARKRARQSGGIRFSRTGPPLNPLAAAWIVLATTHSPHGRYARPVTLAGRGKAVGVLLCPRSTTFARPSVRIPSRGGDMQPTSPVAPDASACREVQTNSVLERPPRPLFVPLDHGTRGP
jgi:hypothetical protein